MLLRSLQKDKRREKDDVQNYWVGSIPDIHKTGYLVALKRVTFTPVVHCDECYVRRKQLYAQGIIIIFCKRFGMPK